MASYPTIANLRDTPAPDGETTWDVTQCIGEQLEKARCTLSNVLGPEMTAEDTRMSKGDACVDRSLHIILGSMVDLVARLDRLSGRLGNRLY